MNEEMQLLKKAHLMYLLEDNLPDLVVGISLKTKYKNLPGMSEKSSWEEEKQVEFFLECPKSRYGKKESKLNSSQDIRKVNMGRREAS